jgi:hypothetical protein
MAAARRLSELLQEQQEPFLVEAPFRARRPWRGARGGPGPGSCCPAAGVACRRLLSLCNNVFKKRRSGGVTGAGGLRSALSKVLCGRAMRRVLRWEDLAGGGCFSGAGGCGGREFRRLRRCSGECDPRTMEFGEEKDEQGRWKDGVDSSRQLSPVSVLERRSDDGSPVHSPCKLYSHSRVSTTINLVLLSYILRLLAFSTAHLYPFFLPPLFALLFKYISHSPSVMYFFSNCGSLIAQIKVYS